MFLFIWVIFGVQNLNFQDCCWVGAPIITLGHLARESADKWWFSKGVPLPKCSIEFHYLLGIRVSFAPSIVFEKVRLIVRRVEKWPQKVRSDIVICLKWLCIYPRDPVIPPEVLVFCSLYYILEVQIPSRVSRAYGIKTDQTLFSLGDVSLLVGWPCHAFVWKKSCFFKGSVCQHDAIIGISSAHWQTTSTSTLQWMVFKP